MVGGLNNLRKILKDEPEVTNLLDSLKGKLSLVHHSRKEYIEFNYQKAIYWAEYFMRFKSLLQEIITINEI